MSLTLDTVLKMARHAYLSRRDGRYLFRARLAAGSKSAFRISLRTSDQKVAVRRVAQIASWMMSVKAAEDPREVLQALWPRLQALAVEPVRDEADIVESEDGEFSELRRFGLLPAPAKPGVGSIRPWRRRRRRQNQRCCCRCRLQAQVGSGPRSTGGEMGGARTRCIETTANARTAKPCGPCCKHYFGPVEIAGSDGK